MKNALQPHQMGFGTRCGAEAIVHASRKFIKTHSTSGMFLKLDFANAFNATYRSKVLEVAHKHVPSLLYPSILQAYGSFSHLFYGDDTIQSAEGLQQGDPLGPLLFCLAVNDLVKSLQSPFNIWYLDDGTFAGPAQLVLEDLLAVQAASSKLGLRLNPAKCELFRIVFGNEDQDVVEQAK
jgi:hypothetical protein